MHALERRNCQRTIDSAAGFFKPKLRPDFDDDSSHCIMSSSPVEKFQAAFHCSGGSFGMAVPTSFTVLQRQKNVYNLIPNKCN